MTHPNHPAMERVTPEITRVAKPLRATWGLLRFKVERACRKSGGHWWHPDPAGMIDWFCCQCGSERDGMPQDGE